jgi:hypothetical protein
LEFSLIYILVRHFSEMLKATGPENIGLERTLPGFLAQGSVLSPTRITFENNEKFCPQPDEEKRFSRASGGGNATAVEPSLEKSK